MRVVDSILDRITMYRLVLYYLIALVGSAIGLAALGRIAPAPLEIVWSTVVLVSVCWVVNKICAWAFDAPTNAESSLITGLILALILTPHFSVQYFALMIWASVWAMASKYLFAIHKQHIFNPVAIAVVITSVFLQQAASWWAGTPALVAFVLIGGLLVVHKLRRVELVAMFFAASAVSAVTLTVLSGGNALGVLINIFVHSPIVFFACVMLTEPLTMPTTRGARLAYAGFIGTLFPPAVHIGSIFSTPELALIAGNIYAYLINPRQRVALQLVKKKRVARNAIDFVFVPLHKLRSSALAFVPGQYMEWTLAHPSADSRGSRRYFTLASSPTEKEIRIGVKFSPDGSSYKHALQQLHVGDSILASHVAGEFTLPKKTNQPLVFIAGGIGITPFRSMVKYMLDTGEQRSISLIAAYKRADEIVYADVFAQAQNSLGMRTIYTLTDEPQDSSWAGERGAINERLIRAAVDGINESLFYISGPHALVQSIRALLITMGVKRRHIKTDFFPGLG